MPAAITVCGWPEERRREEIRRLFRLIEERFQFNRDQAKLALSNRFSVTINTVEGWISDGREGSATARKPPRWEIIEILRYELNEAEPRGLDRYLTKPAAR